MLKKSRTLLACGGSMRISKLWLFVAATLSIVILAFGFQNCAKSKFKDPDHRHTLIAQGFCQTCSDQTGRGLSCRADQISTFSACLYESCNPGYRLENFLCVPVVCESGSIANCAVSHGEGRMTCQNEGLGYSPCTAIDCEPGYTLENGNCVANPPSLCEPGSHRDCSTESTVGIETCNAGGTAYDTCVYGDCRPGYNNESGNGCEANTCVPQSVTPCSVGAAVGFQTCNSAGSGWGVCEVNGCQQGYVLVNGVCTIQVCTPGEESVCEFAHGSGVKICNQTGADYGACTLQGCETGYAVENGECVEQKCAPSSQETCVGESGTGIKYCYENGKGYGVCHLNKCDPGFKLKQGQCVSEESCDEGETQTCTQQNGTGVRTCDSNNGKLGPCVLTTCNSGYELVTQGGSAACKKIK